MSFHKFPIDNQQRKNSIVNIRRDKGASIWFLRGYCSEMAPGTVKGLFQGTAFKLDLN